MGGKSKSQSSSDQTTTQQSSEGIVGGDVLQATTINLTDQFPVGVQEAFSDLIALTGASIEIARDVGSTALTEVSDRRNFEENPVVATTGNAVVPLIIGGVLSLALILIIKKVK